MTTQPPFQPSQPPPYQWTPPQHAAPKRANWFARHKVASAVLAVLAVMAGGSIAAGADTAQTDDPGAATANAEPQTDTAAETVTEEVTPQACIDALDAAERLVHRGVVPAFNAAIDAMDAASRFDTYGIEAATARMERLTPRTERLVDAYNDASEECRAS